MKQSILSFIKNYGKPVKRCDLLIHLRAIGYDISDRAMRKEIESMIIQDGYLIQSSEQGYSMIETEEQLSEAMGYLTSKAEAIAIRKNTLLKNWRMAFKSEPVCQPLLF